MSTLVKWCLVIVAVLGFALQAAAQDAVDIAAAQIGKPYDFFGNGPDLFDCSGLTKFAYAHVGVSLPRHSSDQTQVGQPIESLESVQRGDLLFFAINDRMPREITHVAIYEGFGIMIHAAAPGLGVRRDSIFSSFYAPKFVTARRIAPACPLIPEPGNTTFPPNVAIPTFAVPACPTCDACRLLRRFQTVTIASHQLNGFTNYQFIIRCNDVFDGFFSAEDAAYTLLIPQLGLTSIIPQGATRHMQFSPVCSQTATFSVILRNAQGLERSAGSITASSCCP